MNIHVRSAKLTRRGLLGAGAAGAGLLATGGLGVGPAALAQKKSTGTATRNPLYVPPAFAVGTSPLVAQAATINLGGGHTSPGMAYAPAVLSGATGIPGPTFVGQRNTAGSATINFTNRLKEDTTVHWHGMIVPTTQDGQPHDVVKPNGGTRTYTLNLDQRAAFNWYHPHPHMMVSPQVAMGLAGGFIIRDTAAGGSEAGLNLPAGPPYEVPLVIRDVQLDSRGNLQYKPSSNGYLGPMGLVNGTKDAYLDVHRAVYRFRILNGAPARVFRLALSSGQMVLIGNDGGVLEGSPAKPAEIMLGPAERLDVLIDFRTFAAGSQVTLRCLATGWNLLEFRVGSTSAAGTVPTALPAIPKLASPVRTRDFSFDGMSRINGQIYDMHRTDFTVPFNQVERWRFTTGGNAPHPVHVHGAHFQVVARSGKGARNQILPWERGWKDTVLLQKGETVEVLIRFDRFRGNYLMHCHQLEHEDSGMMMNFVVA